MSASVILTGVAALLFGITWLIQQNRINGITFFIMVFAFLSTITSSSWENIFGILSVVTLVFLIVEIFKRRAN